MELSTNDNRIHFPKNILNIYQQNTRQVEINLGLKLCKLFPNHIGEENE